MLVALQNGDSALSCACREGHTAVVQVLLSSARRLEVSCISLHQACLGGHADVVQLLLADSRVDVSMQAKATVYFGYGLRGEEGSTALHCASSRGSAKVVQMLLADGRVDVNVRTKVCFLHSCSLNANMICRTDGLLF